MSLAPTTDFEKTNLEVHVDMCGLRYQQLDNRLTKVEGKIDELHQEIKDGNNSLVKVIVGAAGSIVAGLLSTIIVLVIKF